MASGGYAPTRLHWTGVVRIFVVEVPFDAARQFSIMSVLQAVHRLKIDGHVHAACPAWPWIAQA
jgi:hypothetical protein